MGWRRGQHALRPDEPEDVEVVYPDGTRKECVVLYAGIEDSVHVWEVLCPEPPPDDAKIVCSWLPPSSALRLYIE